MATSHLVTNDHAGHIEAVHEALRGASEIIVVSGFATLPGFELIRSDVESCLAAGGRVKLILGIDHAGITSADLMTTLGRLLRRNKKQLSVRLVVEQGREFLHAKVYWGERRGATAAHIVVGSTNLTATAFQTNYELSLSDSGNLREHKKRLLDFIGSFRNAQKLTAKGAKKLAKAMRASPQARQDTNLKREKIRETKAGRDRQKTLRNILGSSDSAPSFVHDSKETWEDWATDFVKEGVLLVTDVDLDDMNASTGLNVFYDKGILPKSSHSPAGTAQLRWPRPIARVSLLPENLSTNIATMKKKAGRRLTKYGFKTPFGVWVPKSFLKCVHEGVQRDFSGLPKISDLECAIESELEKHRRSLTETVEETVAQVTDGGICFPGDWRSTPRELRHIQQNCGNDRMRWKRGNSAYDDTLEYISRTLRDKLDRNLKSDICISKIRRLRPGLMRNPANLESDRDSLARFLGEVAWQVAEHLLARKKRTREAVFRMCQRLGDGFRRKPEALAELSSKLLDSSELNENANDFFKAFGRPPYWLPVLECQEVPGLLSVTESQLSNLRFRYRGEAMATARDLDYDPNDHTGVVFWMEEQGERGFSYQELAEKAGEVEWENLTPEDEAFWLLEELLSRGELQFI